MTAKPPIHICSSFRELDSVPIGVVASTAALYADVRHSDDPTIPGPDWTCQDLGPGGYGTCQWYTYIRFENLVLDASMRGGCIKISHSTRITVASTFLTGFSTIGLWAAQPNEDVVFIDSFVGTTDWRSKHCLVSHALRTVGVQFDGPDNLVQNVIMFCTGLGISSTAVDTFEAVHIFTGTSYALDRVADPPIGALWVRGMEYIGDGTGALRGGHKVHTVRAIGCYFDYSAVCKYALNV